MGMHNLACEDSPTINLYMCKLCTRHCGNNINTIVVYTAHTLYMHTHLYPAIYTHIRTYVQPAIVNMVMYAA